MKIKFLAASHTMSPSFYEFSGDVVKVHYNGLVESYDLGELPENATLDKVEKIHGVLPVYSAIRENGEINIILLQGVGPGYWGESDWMDSANYDPDAIHVQYDATRPHAGAPFAYTRQGTVSPLNDEDTHG